VNDAEDRVARPPAGSGARALLARLGEGFETLGWLYRDAFARLRGRIVLVTALDGLSIALGLLVVAGVLKAARAIEAGTPVVLRGGLDLGVMRTSADFAWLGGFFLVLGCASALLAWATDRLVQQAAASYQDANLMRALRRLSAPEPALWTTRLASPPQAVARLATTVAPVILNRWCIWVLRAIRPSLILAVAVVVMLAIDVRLTLLLLPLLPVYLLSLVRLSARAREVDRAWRSARADFRDGLARWQPLPATGAGEADLAGLERLHAAVSRGLRDRRLMVSGGTLVNGLFAAVTLAVLFATAASQAAAGRPDWAGLILYVVCLRFVVAGLRENTALLMRLQLQGRQVAPFRALVDPAAPAPPRPPADCAVWLAQPEAIVLLIVPWRPSALDLALAEALLLPALDGRRPARRSLDAGDGGAAEAAPGPPRATLALAREWRTLATKAAPGPPRPHGPLLLVEGSSVSPATVARRADGHPITGVVVWDGRNFAGCGSWDWFQENAAGLRPHQAPAESATGFAEGALDDEDVSNA